MTGTQLVLMAMYSTANVVGPAGMHLHKNLIPIMMCLLVAAVALTSWQIFTLSRLPKRPSQKGRKFKPLRRSHAVPAFRR